MAAEYNQPGCFAATPLEKGGNNSAYAAAAAATGFRLDCAALACICA